MIRAGAGFFRLLIVSLLFLACATCPPSLRAASETLSSAAGSESSSSSAGPGESYWWPMSGHDPQNSGFAPSTVPGHPQVLWQLTQSYWRHSEPTVADGRVFVNREDDLVCLDALYGSELWTFESVYPLSEVISAPAVADGLAYVGCKSVDGYGAMVCLEAQTGLERWRAYVGGSWWYSQAWRPIICGNHVYYRTFAGEEFGYYWDTSWTLQCRNRFTGEPVWVRYFGESNIEQPCLGTDKELYVTVSKDQILMKIDAGNGNIIWERDDHFFNEAFVYGEGKLYGTTFYPDQLLCLNPQDGSVVWSVPVMGSYRQPAVGGGRVYISGAGGKFSCFNAESGEEIWSASYDAGGFSGASIGQNGVLIVTADDYLRCLDAETGSERWRLPFAFGEYDRPIAIADGRVYFSGEEIVVLCLGEPPQTLTASLRCQPASGTVPFVTNMSFTLINQCSLQSRTAIAHIDVTLGDGSFYPSWRTGWTILQPGSHLGNLWQQSIPAYPAFLGANTFDLYAEDVTPAPYNQPPYPPSGDTATDCCTVAGLAP